MGGLSTYVPILKKGGHDAMSDDINVRGPVMLAATSMLRPPPARIAKLGEDFILPRSVPVKSLIGGVVGLFIGLVLYFLIVVPIFGFMLEFMLIVIGGLTAIGVMIVNWSPLKGENWATWATLKVGTASRGKVIIDGHEVRAYIGIAMLPYSAAGKIVIQSGSDEVLPGSVDSRGASLSAIEILRSKKGSTPFPKI